MLSLALTLALTITPDDAWARDPTPEPRPVRSASASRVKRFFGSLAGGALGVGLPLAFLPLADQGCAVTAGFSRCPTAAHAMIIGASIIFSLVGSLSGHLLVNDEASFGAGVGGTLVGLALAMALVAGVHMAAVRDGGAVSVAPYVTAGALLIASQAFALTWRSEALDESRTREIEGVRFALETGTFVLSSVLGLGLTLLATAISSGSGCWRTNTCAVAPVIVGAISAGLVPLATWGAHQARGGRGTLATAYLATLATGVAAFLAGLVTAVPLGVPTFPPTLDGGRTSITTASAAVIGAVLLGVFTVPLGLEVSHQLTQGGAAATAVSFGAGPVAGGAVGVVGGRF